MKITPQESKQSAALIEVVSDAKENALARQKALTKLAKNATIKGFRKGKAPLSIVESQLDPEAINHESLHFLLEEIIPAVIKSENLHLISNPQLITLDDKNPDNWILTISFPLKPIIILGDYEKHTKKSLDTTESKKTTRETRVDIVCNTLVKQIDFDLPQVLLDQEVDKSLSRLLEQTQALGLTIEKYLTSINKSVDQLKIEYFESAKNTLKLEFILLEIAKEKKLIISEKEIKDLITTIGDEKTQNLFRQKEQLPYLESILLKRKVIDSLLTN